MDICQDLNNLSESFKSHELVILFINDPASDYIDSVIKILYEFDI